MTIRWITRQLGTAPASAVEADSDLSVIDVRNLVDKAGNSVEVTRQKIQEGLDSISQGRRTVICCDYGMSRSNAIAVGVLANFENISFAAALRKVLEATGETEIKLQPLGAVREALGEGLKEESAKSQRTILVTGGNGFLGKSFQAASGGEYKLVTPSSNDLDIASGSTQLSLMANEANVDCIVHLANPRVYTSNVALGNSLTMLRNVIDVCLANNIRLIYPSGWEIYSGYSGTLAANESTPALPRGPYGEAKYLAELLIDHCRRTENLSCLTLRSGPVYGAFGDKPKFIFNFISKALRGETISTHEYKNGAPSLDLLYVDDFVAALLAALKSDFTGDLNTGTGQLTSTKEVAKMVVEKLGSKSQVEQVTIDTGVASVAMNWRKAREVLNWQPVIEVEDGIERVLSKFV
jgi:nucleoside-diphosphate-sugar epimerase